MFSNSEIEPKKTWPSAQFFFYGKANLDSTCLEEPFEKNFLKRKGFFSTCLDREQNNFVLVDKISRKDVKNSFYFSTITIWGNFFLKACKYSIFFWPLSKNFVEQSRGEASRRFVGNLCQQQRYTKEVLLTFPKNCGFEKQNLRQALRSFFRSLISHSNKRFCLWDLLSAHASVWQRLHLRALNKNWWRIKKYKKWCDFEKKQFQWNKRKQSLSRATFSLHETPTKNRLNFFQRGRSKISQKNKTQTHSDSTPSCRRLFFHFPFLLTRPFRKMKSHLFGGGNHQHLNF